MVVENISTTVGNYTDTAWWYIGIAYILMLVHSPVWHCWHRRWCGQKPGTFPQPASQGPCYHNTSEDWELIYFRGWTGQRFLHLINSTKRYNFYGAQLNLSQSRFEWISLIWVLTISEVGKLRWIEMLMWTGTISLVFLPDAWESCCQAGVWGLSRKKCSNKH